VKASLFALCLFLASAPLSARDMWTNLFEENLARAEAGDQDAAYEVGIMYLKGQGIGADRDKASEWLQQAADGGSESAANKLSRMEASAREFAHWLRKAEAGDKEAQYETGMMYMSGKGVAADMQAAVRWLEQASGQGDIKATARLGIIYLKGEGVAAAPKRAVSLLTQASDEEVLAKYYLGEAYAEGLGVRKNFQEAIAWYQKAADAGFGRAAGKIINIEEEIRMAERRQERQAREAESKAALEARKKERAARKAASKTAGPVIRDIGYLSGHNWTSDGKAARFLPSSLNECEHDKNRLVCYSEHIEETSVGRKLRYRVKSIIKPGSVAETFDIVYRNLVLDVELLDVDSGPVGYGQGGEQGFKVKTGWTREHIAACKFVTDQTLNCRKDGIHDMTARRISSRSMAARR
jgi:TPR repeat protein